MRDIPQTIKCVWVCAALQRHFSPMICLSLILSPSCSLSNYFVLVSPSQCLHRPEVFSVLSLQSSSIRVLRPNKTFFNRRTKAAMYFYVWHLLPLSHLCPVSTFFARPSSPLPDCNNVSRCGSAWSWMLTIFNTTRHLSTLRLVIVGGKTKWCDLKCFIWRSSTSHRASHTTFHTW